MSIRNKNLPKSTTSSRPAENVDSLPWPEWKDAELNAEKWSTGKSGADGLFVDSNCALMPPSLNPYEWIRAKDLKHLNEPLTVFTASAKYPDLITNNKHLLHSEFMRWFISAIVSLQYCGRNGLEISGENPNFAWNGRQQPWQGWMHIYSMNKTGKGVQHKPIVNPTGKYIARLYFMGRWRRVALDDAIPVDEAGNPLLPRTVNNFELWPMLLAKALLKLASITWTEMQEIVDFHPVACLTGWVCLKLPIAHLSYQDKWDFLTKYAEHFEWNPEITGYDNQKNTERPVKQETSKDIPLKSKLPDKSQPVTLFLELKDMRRITSDIVPGLSPCWSHFVHVIQSRDVPLDPKDVKPPLARWKLYRWLKWAIAQNLIDPAEYFVPIRYLKIVSPLGNTNETIININNDSKTQEIPLQDKSTNRMETTSPHQRNKTEYTPIEFQENKPSEESRLNSSQWCDFNKMSPYIKEAHLFYKIEYFSYKIEVSDELSNDLSNIHKSDATIKDSKESKKGSKKSSPSKATSNKETELVEIYSWPVKMSEARNEPLYLLCDSLEEKFFLISFSTYEPPSNASTIDSTSRGTEEEAASARWSREKYLLVEPHSWFHRPTHSEPLACISTAGTKSLVMELQPGRHLLRVYCNSECRRWITIASDTIFHLGDRPRMHRLMSLESHRLVRAVKRISDCAIAAFRSFGSRNYPSALKSYYRSYALDMSEEIKRKDKALRKRIHGYFMKEQVALIKELLSRDDTKEVLRSLRIFFLDPSIGRVCTKDSSHVRKHVPRYTRKHETNTVRFHEGESPNRNHAAAIIQSFFKMLLILKYKEIHDPVHELHKSVLDNLRKVAELFDYSKDESLARRILTNTLKRDDRLLELYPCSKDLQHVLQVQRISGSLRSLKPGQWVPILRLILNPPESESVFAGFDLFVNLRAYTLRVFNNETGLEILRIASNAVPARYRYSRMGYTVFGYGWSEDRRSKESDWTLHVTSMKGEPVFRQLEGERLSPLVNLPSLMVDEFSDVYIPNSRNCITRWIVEIRRRSFVSLRLRTSYELARIRLQVVDEEDSVLRKVEGTSKVILPVACLEYKEASVEEESRMEDASSNNLSDEKKESVSRRVYYIEAFVLEDSWPLTEFEWSVVKEAKARGSGSSSKPTLSSVPISKLSKSDLSKSRKGSKQSLEDHRHLNSPYWVLQVVTDPGSDLEISKDRTKERELAAMKEAWARENPQSLQRGMELREEFKKQHAIARSSSSDKSFTMDRKVAVKKSSDRTIDASLPRSSAKESRTLQPPRDSYLPPLDLTIYARKEDQRRRSSIKTTIVEEPEKVREKLLKILADALKDQRQTYEEFFQNYKDNFWKRRKLVDQAYEDLKSYIESTKPKGASSKTKVKGKKARRVVL